MEYYKLVNLKTNEFYNDNHHDMTSRSKMLERHFDINIDLVWEKSIYNLHTPALCILHTVKNHGISKIKPKIVFSIINFITLIWLFLYLITSTNSQFGRSDNIFECFLNGVLQSIKNAVFTAFFSRNWANIFKRISIAKKRCVCRKHEGESDNDETENCKLLHFWGFGVRFISIVSKVNFDAY